MSDSSAPPPDPNKIAAIANTFRKQREEKKIIIVKEEPQVTPPAFAERKEQQQQQQQIEKEFIPVSKPDQDERVIPIRNTSVNLTPQAVSGLRTSLYASTPIVNNNFIPRELPQQKQKKNISETFSTLMKVSAAVFIAGFIFGFIAVPLFKKNENNNNDDEIEEEILPIVKHKK